LYACFHRHRLNLVIGYFDILAVADLIALDDVRIADRLSGRSVEFAAFDPISRLSIDLMKSDFFSLGDGGEKLDRT
jgi:hypothetical protein